MVNGITQSRQELRNLFLSGHKVRFYRAETPELCA